MRLATALLFFVQIALCGGAPAARMRMRTRAAAAVAAPVAAPLAPPAAAANIDGNEDIDDDDNTRPSHRTIQARDVMAPRFENFGPDPLPPGPVSQTEIVCDGRLLMGVWRWLNVEV